MDIPALAFFAAALNPTPITIIGSLIPDIPAIGSRRRRPNEWYTATHSILFILLTSAFSPDLGIGVASHVGLDLLSHGETFSPRLLFPASRAAIIWTEEWEFGNRIHLCGWIIIIVAWTFRLGFLSFLFVP